MHVACSRDEVLSKGPVLPDDADFPPAAISTRADVPPGPSAAARSAGSSRSSACPPRAPSLPILHADLPIPSLMRTSLRGGRAGPAVTSPSPRIVPKPAPKARCACLADRGRRAVFADRTMPSCIPGPFDDNAPRTPATGGTAP